MHIMIIEDEPDFGMSFLLLSAIYAIYFVVTCIGFIRNVLEK